MPSPRWTRAEARRWQAEAAEAAAEARRRVAEAAQWHAALPTLIAQLLAGLGETWAPMAAAKLAEAGAAAGAAAGAGAAWGPPGPWGAWGLALGAALHWLLADRWGRRRTMLLIPAVAAVNSVQSYASGGVRLTAVLWGACSGVGLTTSYVYLAEIAAAGLRGRLCCTALAFHSLGRLYMRTVGAPLALPTLGLLALPFALLDAVLILYAPDTPYHHARHRRPAHMLQALAALRSDDTLAPHVRAEAVGILDRVAAERASPCPSRGPSRGCVLVMGLVGTIPLSGVTLTNADPSLLCGPWDCGAVLGGAESVAAGAVVAQLCAQLVAAALVDTAGRRPLLLAGCLGMAVTSAALVTLHGLPTLTPALVPAWVPLALQQAQGTAFYLGPGTVAFVYLGELLPLCRSGSVPAAATCLFAALHTALQAAVSLPHLGALALSAAAGAWASLLGLAALWGAFPESHAAPLHLPSLILAQTPRRPSKVQHL